MSELQLSAQLIEQLRQAVIEQDEQANNPVVCSQYLAAAMACMIADTSLSNVQKQDVLEGLAKFTQRVVADMNQPAAPAQPAADEPAYGTWKPEKK